IQTARSVAFPRVPMRCSNCGNENPADKKFCEDCGASLANRCPKCGAETTVGKRFCGECGTAIGASASLVTSSAQPGPLQLSDAIAATAVIDGERKTVTALFADIKGSTELMEDLDPEEAAQPNLIRGPRLFGGLC